MYITNPEIIKVNQYFLNHKNNFNKEIGLIMKEARVKKHITAENLAERAITSSSYIKQIENGNYGLSLSKFIVICNSLEIKPQDIIENFIFGDKVNEDLIYIELQNGKNISKNILEFMKKTDSKNY